MARPWKNVLDYNSRGLRRDSGADWTDLIQRAIDDLVSRNLKDDKRGDLVEAYPPTGTLYFPPGLYRITKPLFVAWRESDTVFWNFNLELVGDAPGITAREETGATHASIIQAEFNDLPAIIIQKARWVRLRNLAIVGQNDWTSVPGRDPLDMRVHFDDDNYYVQRPLLAPPPRAPRPRDARYSPYAAICVDPFSGQPVVPEAERYPGLSPDLYDPRKVESTQVHVDDCYIRGFVTGISLSVGGGVNCENIRVSDTTIESTVSAFTSGNSQNRHLVLDNVTIRGAKFAINCADYGDGTGNCPSVFGARISGVRYLLNARSVGSSACLSGLKVDHFVSLGQLEGKPTYDGYVFDGCHFDFGAVPAELRAPDAHLLNYAQAVFRDCTFEIGEPERPDLTADDPIRFSNSATLSFIGCRFHARRATVAPPLWVSTPSGNPEAVAQRFEDCLLTAPGVSQPFSQQAEAAPASTPIGALFRSARRALTPGPLPRWVAGPLPRVPLGLGRILRESGTGEIVFVVTTRLDEPGIFSDDVRDAVSVDLGNAAGMVRPGDLVASDTAVQNVRLLLPGEDPRAIPPGREAYLVMGRVVSAAVQRRAASPLDAPYLELRVVLSRVPASLVVDTVPPGLLLGERFELHVSYFPRVHPLTFGNVQRGSRFVQIIDVEGDLAEAWRVGDRIRGRGIAPGTWVRNVNTLGLPLPTLELSTRALADGSGVRLFDADTRDIDLG